MHLVDISLFYPARTGGVGTYLRAKSRWLRAHTALRHTVVAPSVSGEPECDVVGVPSVPIPGSGGFRWPVSAGFATRALLQLAPQLIEAGDPYQFAWSTLAAKRRLDINALAFFHSDLPRLAGARFGRAAQRAAECYVGRLYRQFDLVLAPSRGAVDKLHALGVRQAVHQPLGVDTALFTPALRTDALRRQLGLDDDTRLLVYAGRFSRAKNLPLLLEAVARLGRGWHLLLVGGGGAYARSAAVTCLPFQRDPHALARLLASCDLFVHPGPHETFGLVVLEALACGVPVLGVAGGGVAELVDEGCGLLVRPGCGAALAEGLRALAGADLRRLGDNGRRRVLARYDWDRIMPQLVARYASLAGARWSARAAPVGSA